MKPASVCGRLVTVFVLAMCGIVAASSVAWGWSKGAPRRNDSPLLVIPYSWGGNLQAEGTPWKAAFRHGLTAWNNTPTKARFKLVTQRSGTAPNVINTYHNCVDKNFGATYSYLDSTGYVTSTVILGNACYAPSVFTTPEEYTSTATHELGHAIGLGHTSVMPAIMNQARNRKKIWTVQEDDIDGVNAIYPIMAGRAEPTGQMPTQSPPLAQTHAVAQSEYPVVTALADLVEQSTLIAVGKVVAAQATENMARSAKDHAQPDPFIEMRGVDYTVRAEGFLKGNGPRELVVTDMKTLSVSGGTPTLMKGYREMSPGGRYIFFLRKSPVDGNHRWIGVAEPWRFQLQGGKATVTSMWEDAPSAFPTSPESDFVAKVKAAVTGNR